MEDGRNIQRNVWRMAGTYRGMYEGWEEHTERNVSRMGGTYRGRVERTEDGWKIEINAWRVVGNI